MLYKPFGATGLTVSEVGFGCARIGGFFSGQRAADLVSLLREAFDQGLTFYDTADMYAQGESEKLIGQAFPKDRHRVIIASKVGYCLSAQRTLAARVKPLLKPLARRLGISRPRMPAGWGGAISQDFSTEYILTAVDASLRRLRTDYLDLYQLHSPPTRLLEQGDLLGPLEQLKAQGKIRFFGVACERVEDVLICLRYPQISFVQVSLSLLHQEALQEAIPCAAQRGVAVIARQCFASGVLAKPLDDLATDSNAQDPILSLAQRAEITRYHRIAKDYGRPLRALALQFAQTAPGVSTTLVGLRTSAHLGDMMSDLSSPSLSEPDFQALRRHAPSEART